MSVTYLRNADSARLGRFVEADPYAWPYDGNLRPENTALVVIDPQNDVLSEKGVSWPLVGSSVKENNTVENLERLFRAAKAQGFGVFISPHYLYPYDQGWQFGGALEKMMLEGKEFWRPDPLRLDGKQS